MVSKGKKGKVIVIKLGSATLIKENGEPNIPFVGRFAGEIANAKKSGHSVYVVTSGAVALGMSKLKLKDKTLTNQQAASAVGQSFLMHLYNTFLEKFGLVTSQFLVSSTVFQNEALSGDLKKILEKVEGTIPIFNENDAIYSQGLAGYFDNDMLAANLSILLNADMLVVISEVGGLYTSNPSSNASAKKIDVVAGVKEEHLKMAGEKSPQGRGGMLSKLKAIELATENGITTVLTSHKTENFLARAIAGENIGTVFEGVKNGSN